MSFIIHTETYTPPPEGLHQAVCVDLIDLGIVDGKYGRRRKCRLKFELEALMESGRHYTISKTYTASMNEKSTLHQDLRAWRGGRPFTRQEIKDFDLERVIGQSCQLLVMHVERDGNVYGNIKAITKPEKGKEYRASGEYQRTLNRPSDVVADYDDSSPAEEARF